MDGLPATGEETGTETFAATELADRVAEASRAATAERDRILQVSSLLDQRLAQCRQVAAATV